MYSGRLVFAQLMEHLPLHSFRSCVARYSGNRRVQSFTCLDQFLCMAFAQLTSRLSLRAVELALRAHRSKVSIQKPGRRGRAEPMLGKPGDGGVQREREGRGGPSRTVRQSLCRG